MNKGRLIVYSGPSGVGKGTILKPLLAPEGKLMLSVSATTRAPRPGEENGREYFFVSRERFEEMITAGDMLEYAQYNGNYYGTPKSFVEKQREGGVDVVLEIETQGALKVKELCPDAVMIFVMPPSYQALHDRLTGRGTETPEQQQGRLNEAIREMQLAEKYDFVIINDDLDKAREDLLRAINAGALTFRANRDFVAQVLQNAEK
ncbi:MAG: guanylate kinase [Oscillospiraceae bacterium]|nr:guanylate kinase [Oscillospiraceae bacterium]